MFRAFFGYSWLTIKKTKVFIISVHGKIPSIKKQLCVANIHTLGIAWNVYEVRLLLVVLTNLYFLLLNLQEVKYVKLLMGEEKPLRIYAHAEQHFGEITE